MSERECIYAYTPAGADYPPYLNITREADGRVFVIVRGSMLTPDDTDYPFDMPGHTVRIELGREQIMDLEAHLRGAYVRERVAFENSGFDWGALQALRKASA